MQTDVAEDNSLEYGLGVDLGALLKPPSPKQVVPVPVEKFKFTTLSPQNTIRHYLTVRVAVRLGLFVPVTQKSELEVQTNMGPYRALSVCLNWNHWERGPEYLTGINHQGKGGRTLKNLKGTL